MESTGAPYVLEADHCARARQRAAMAGATSPTVSVSGANCVGDSLILGALKAIALSGLPSGERKAAARRAVELHMLGHAALGEVSPAGLGAENELEAVLARVKEEGALPGRIKVEDGKAWLRGFGPRGDAAASMLGKLSSARNRQCHHIGAQLLSEVAMLAEANLTGERTLPQAEAAREVLEPRVVTQVVAAAMQAKLATPMAVQKGVSQATQTEHDMPKSEYIIELQTEQIEDEGEVCGLGVDFDWCALNINSLDEASCCFGGHIPPFVAPYDKVEEQTKRSVPKDCSKLRVVDCDIDPDRVAMSRVLWADLTADDSGDEPKVEENNDMMEKVKEHADIVETVDSIVEGLVEKGLVEATQCSSPVMKTVEDVRAELYMHLTHSDGSVNGLEVLGVDVDFSAGRYEVVIAYAGKWNKQSANQLHARIIASNCLDGVDFEIWGEVRSKGRRKTRR